MAYKVTQNIKYNFFNLFIIKSIHLIKIYIAIVYIHLYIVHFAFIQYVHCIPTRPGLA